MTRTPHPATFLSLVASRRGAIAAGVLAVTLAGPALAEPHCGGGERYYYEWYCGSDDLWYAEVVGVSFLDSHGIPFYTEGFVTSCSVAQDQYVAGDFNPDDPYPCNLIVCPLAPTSPTCEYKNPWVEFPEYPQGAGEVGPPARGQSVTWPDFGGAVKVE